MWPSRRRRRSSRCGAPASTRTKRGSRRFGGRLAELTLAVDRHQNQAGHAKQQLAETETRAGEAAREAAELQGRVGPLHETLEARRSEGSALRE